MQKDIQATVHSPEAAARLKLDFEELLARVNADMAFTTMSICDPISVEAAVASAERSIEHHLRDFAEDLALQALKPELLQRFRTAIYLQAQV